MILQDNGYEVEPILASRWGDYSVLTLRLRYPRLILSELNTHRGLSKNSGSSRAIPTKRMLEQVINEPAMPYRFGANQTGMQDKGKEHTESIKVPEELKDLYCHGFRGAWNSPYLDFNKVLVPSRIWWRFLAWVNALGSKAFSDAGYHKQVANRVTEPYQWMNTIVTGTENMWKHFLWLRDDPAADPTIQHLASMVRQVREQVVYQPLEPGQWHLPYSLSYENDFPLMGKLILSTARLARISIEPFDGDPSYEREESRHDLLVKSVPPHMSPTEHPCTPMEGRWGNFEGFKQYRQFLENGEAIV